MEQLVRRVHKKGGRKKNQSRTAVFVPLPIALNSQMLSLADQAILKSPSRCSPLNSSWNGLMMSAVLLMCWCVDRDQHICIIKMLFFKFFKCPLAVHFYLFPGALISKVPSNISRNIPINKLEWQAVHGNSFHPFLWPKFGGSNDLLWLLTRGKWEI